MLRLEIGVFYMKRRDFLLINVKKNALFRQNIIEILFEICVHIFKLLARSAMPFSVENTAY